MRLRTRFLLAVLCALTALTHAQSAGVSLLNKPAPEFARTTLNGGTVKLSDDRGRVVALNFWASWCGPCLKEMPVFDGWQAEFGTEKLAVIGISIDDDREDAKRAVERLRIHYPVAMGDEELGLSYGGILGVPITFLIDRKGVVRARFEGETEPGLIREKIVELIGER